MPKRVVVPHFQNPWTDTSFCDSSGTVACPVAASPPSFPPPFMFSHRYPRSVPVPLPLYCRTVGFRSVGTALGLMAWTDRAPHSLAASLCRGRTIPPLEHDKVCSTDNFLPQPSQSVGRFNGTITYRGSRFSWNSSHDNSVPLRRWGIAVSHYLFSIAFQRQFIHALSTSSFPLISNAFFTSSHCFHLLGLAQHTQPLCTTCLRSVPPRSEPTSTSMDDLELLYARSADIRGSGIPRPQRFTLWPRIYLRLSLTSSPPKSAGEKASLRESSIGPIR